MSVIKDNILDIADNHYKYLINLQNVVGVGFGHKRINEVNTFEPCIHVLVKDKINSSYILPNNIIPKTFMGIKTDVIEIGTPVAQVIEGFLPEKVRPLKGGYGISTDSGGTGTIGCIVKKVTKNKVEYFILSNNHVLAGYNKFSIGSSVFQPSKDDHGTDDDIIGNLSAFVRLKFKNKVYTPTNYTDCAIAKISPFIISNEVEYIGKLKGSADPIVDSDVFKTGTTSGSTNGQIETIGTTIEINYDNNTKTALFKKQITTYIHSEPGDSGSALVNTNDKVVGLLFSGTDKNMAICNDINLVLNSLKVEIYTV